MEPWEDFISLISARSSSFSAPTSKSYESVRHIWRGSTHASSSFWMSNAALPHPYFVPPEQMAFTKISRFYCLWYFAWLSFTQCSSILFSALCNGTKKTQFWHFSWDRCLVTGSALSRQKKKWYPFSFFHKNCVKMSHHISHLCTHASFSSSWFLELFLNSWHFARFFCLLQQCCSNICIMFPSGFC